MSYANPKIYLEFANERINFLRLTVFSFKWNNGRLLNESGRVYHSGAHYGTYNIEKKILGYNIKLILDGCGWVKFSSGLYKKKRVVVGGLFC